jgi:TetR/AcrR family transcriptional repressor of nem operon
MPAGRPRTFDTDEALAAAMRVFWRRGFRATTTRDLEDELGLGQSSISAAFGTKSDLADAALARYVGMIRRALLVPLRESDDGLAAIDRFLGDLSDWHCADGGRGCMLGRFMCEGVASEPKIAARIREYRDELHAALGGALARAAAAGEIPAERVDERRDLIVAVVLGMNLAVQAGYDVPGLRGLARAGRLQIASWAPHGTPAARRRQP